MCVLQMQGDVDESEQHEAEATCPGSRTGQGVCPDNIYDLTDRDGDIGTVGIFDLAAGDDEISTGTTETTSQFSEGLCFEPVA